MGPKLRVIPNSEWMAHLRNNGINPTYMKIAAKLKLASFFAPRGYYSRGIIYVKRSQINNHKLLTHELGHALGWVKHDHPVSIFGGISHAISVGFDVRAFTGILRLRRGPKLLREAYLDWRESLA